MDEDFAKKIKRKRIRAVVLVVVLAAVAVCLLWNFRVEKADYREPLISEIEKAEELYAEKAESGDDAYTAELLQAFQEQIREARSVADADSGYTAEKEAYETLKSQTAAFRRGEAEAAGKETPDGEMIHVSIEIRCDTLAEDLSQLSDPSLADEVPEDGVILPVTELEVEAGSTAYDLLEYVCRDQDIQLEASSSPAFNSYYVEGIHYLYEFDAGPLSGWMFQVNDGYPTYGSGSYVLEDGDATAWVYTCDQGEDLGRKNTGLD